PPAEPLSSVGGIHPGMAAGDGVLAIGATRYVSAWASAIPARPRGASIGTNTFVARSGDRVYMAGGIGRARRHAGRPIALQANVWPFRRWRTIARDRQAGDGYGYWAPRIARNTRLRSAGGGVHSARLTVFGVPRIHLRLGRRGRNTITAAVRLRAAA